MEARIGRGKMMNGKVEMIGNKGEREDDAGVNDE